MPNRLDPGPVTARGPRPPQATGFTGPSDAGWRGPWCWLFLEHERSAVVKGPSASVSYSLKMGRGAPEPPEPQEAPKDRFVKRMVVLTLAWLKRM